MRRSLLWMVCLCGCLAASPPPGPHAHEPSKVGAKASPDAPDSTPPKVSHATAVGSAAVAHLASSAAATVALARPASGATKDAGAQTKAGWLRSVRYKTWIWPHRKKGGRFLGYMRVGQRVRLRQKTRLPGENCRGGFWAIEPRGYVCHDRTVSRSHASRFMRANALTMPSDGAFPYNYALSNGSPMYSRLPTRAEEKRHAWRYGKAGTFRRLSMFQRGHEHLARVRPIEPNGALPFFLRGGAGAYGRPEALIRRDIPHGAMLAYTRSFEHNGRTFLLSTDLTVVPANRVRPFERSRFSGVQLGGPVRLPMGFVKAAAKLRKRRPDGSFQETNSVMPARAPVQLSGENRDGMWQLTSGQWLAKKDLHLVQLRKRRPFGVRPGEKWIIVRIGERTLVAYDDLKPVFVTLVSPGIGGIPRKGGDLVKDSTTPLGSYRITFKDRAATMASQKRSKHSTWIADVPFTLYFRPPFAIHAAYWHDRFGDLMSAGCINASPLDAKWLFDWSDPQVPSGWQGATGAGAVENGGSTFVVVTR
jgi:hypothetical protein